MATSSIFNIPKFDTQESVERLVKALEEAEKCKRCEDCAYLVMGDRGEWVCDDCGKNVVDIPDDECSAEQKW